MKQLAVVILAAGLGTRMKSKSSKVMHPVAGYPLISYPIVVARGLKPARLIVVHAPDQADLKQYLKSCRISSVVQREARGTADAVQTAGRGLASFSGYVLVLYGDVPLVRTEVIREFISEVGRKGARLGVITMSIDDPRGYGRIIRDPDGELIRIVEDKDATEDEKRIHEVNTGIICAERGWLFDSIKKIGCRNAKGEFYLTDLVSLAVGCGCGTVGWRAAEALDFLGVNTRVDLSVVARIMRERINKRHMLDGVGILDHLHTTVDGSVRIGMDTTIMPYSFLLGQMRVGKDCIIENGVVIRDSVIGDGVHIKAHSVIENSVIADNAVIGPFARIRPGSKVGHNARVGNFVELKKCDLGAYSKANHLSYLGDTTVGRLTNIGCGTITCNYDGRAKHKTVIGEGAFIGSDVQFIAPVRIGRGSVIGAGSTITQDVPANALALSRAEQKIVKGWAKRKRGPY